MLIYVLVKFPDMDIITAFSAADGAEQIFQIAGIYTSAHEQYTLGH